MTYGRSIGKALDKFSIDRETWPQLAADRGAWRDGRCALATPQSAARSGSHSGDSAPARTSPTYVGVYY